VRLPVKDLAIGAVVWHRRHGEGIVVRNDISGAQVRLKTGRTITIRPTDDYQWSTARRKSRL